MRLRKISLRSGIFMVTAVTVSMLTLTNPLHASLVITPAGSALGFSLSNFVTGFGNPTGCCGPLGMAVASNGNVVVDASNLSMNYVFSDVDGQTLGTAISHTAFSGFPPAYAASNGAVWGSGGFSGPNAGHLIKFNNDGTTNTVYTISGLSVTNGLWTNPVNGHLLGTDGSNIYDIDVSGATPTFRIAVTGVGSDGLTVSPDGTTVFTTAVAGYSIATGALLFSPLAVAGGPDGMGIITSSNSLNGDIIVNTNGGTVVLIDTVTRAETTIATGGTRGDYAAADTSNGTLFLTQSDSIVRLSCGSACGIGSGPVGGAPEPTTLFTLGTGILAFGLLRRRRSS